jgi:hypothetical protein
LWQKCGTARAADLRRALRLPPSIVMVALLAGGKLMGVVGALLALPIAAAMRMLVDQLRVELPGEIQNAGKIHARDDRLEREYELRAEGIPAERAAAIALEIAEIRRDADLRPSGESPADARKG